MRRSLPSANSREPLAYASLTKDSKGTAVARAVRISGIPAVTASIRSCQTPALAYAGKADEYRSRRYQSGDVAQAVERVWDNPRGFWEGKQR